MKTGTRWRTDEEKASSLLAHRARTRQSNRAIWREAGYGGVITSFLDEGDDRYWTVASGSDRAMFNLGEGSRWRRSRRYT